MVESPDEFLKMLQTANKRVDSWHHSMSRVNSQVYMLTKLQMLFCNTPTMILSCHHQQYLRL